MAQRSALDGRDSLQNPPSVVEVTIEPGPRGRVAAAGAVRVRALVVLSLVLAGAVIGGVLVAAGGGGAARRGFGQTRSASATPAQAGPRLRGMGQVTAVTAYRFPLGCMGMTLTRRALAHALRSRSGPCWRYGVFVTAILRRSDGVWQLALEATSRSCPRIALPPNIRANLAVCRR
jgi:preprotein translocase subunit SecG